MVSEKTLSGEKVYVCEVCHFTFTDKSWAEKCERFCREKGACSMDITSHALERKDK